MEKFGKVIVKLRIPILILSFLLLIPSAIGYFNTRVNYDILYYLPNEIETMQGQDILMDDFNKGAYAMVVVQNMDTKSTDRLIKKVENVDHVAQVISYTGIVGEDVPSEIVPSKFRKYFENDSTDTTLFAIFFDNTTSSDDTMNAIIQIREQTEGQAGERDTTLCTYSSSSCMYRACYIYGFISCTSILYDKYRNGNCIQPGF